MKLKSFAVSKRFIPEFNENKKQPVDKQIVITFSRIPGTSEVKNYKTISQSKSGEFSLNYKDDMLIATYVEKVENLQIGDDKIKNGIELSQAVHPLLEDLFTEIRDYLFPENDELTEGEQTA